MEESTAVAMLAGILALVAKELIAYLRIKKTNGNPGNPGNPHPAPVVDLSGVEAKLEKIITGIEGLHDLHARTLRTLDDLQHSSDKTWTAIGETQESLRMLEKALRNQE